MKIVCKKGYNAKDVLQFITEYIEKKSVKYPLLNKDMEIEISLGDVSGEECPDNDKEIYFSDDEMDIVHEIRKSPEYYYNNDTLTGLYNRSKYEHDINMFRLTGYSSLICIYIDAVGLHEINNHLGHKAGDHMLCSVADGIRKHFLHSEAYRIGGDEFVVFCLETSQTEVVEKIASLKSDLRRLEYEISVGMDESTDSKTLNDTINHAEKAMRQDKKSFYRKNGGVRQNRDLNYKLEKLLLEKQDANHFLNVIAPKYKGVYIVNPEKDTCRYIYVPPYFQRMLHDNHGLFSFSMRDYRDELVRREYYDRFEQIFDYEYIQEQLDAGNEIDFTYQKLDGNWVKLKITTYDEASSDSDAQEMLWIFLDEMIR